MRLSLVTGAIASLCVGVALGADTVRATGVYSSLYFNKEGGDLLGAEILIFPSKGPTGFFALVQLAEGGAPFAVLVPVRVAGTQVEFTMPVSGPYGGLNFTGTITRGNLTAGWSGPAGRSAWALTDYEDTGDYTVRCHSVLHSHRQLPGQSLDCSRRGRMGCCVRGCLTIRAGSSREP